MSDQKNGDFQFPTSDQPKVDNHQPKVTPPEPVDEESIDNGVEETFPASDPVSVSVTKVRTGGS